MGCGFRINPLPRVCFLAPSARSPALQMKASAVSSAERSAAAGIAERQGTIEMVNDPPDRIEQTG